MGNNSSSCSKNIENTCEVNRVDCECPNGVAYPGKCNINDKIRCIKCLPNFGANEESNIYFDSKGKYKKKHNGKFKDLNEYNNNIKGYKSNINIVSNYKAQRNKNISGERYSYFTNVPNFNNHCKLMNNYELDFSEQVKKRNLNKLKINCDEILKADFVDRMTSGNSNKKLQEILTHSLKDKYGRIDKWRNKNDSLTNIEVYNILQEILNESNSNKDLIKSYSVCTDNKMKNNSKTVKELLQRLSYIEVDNYDSIKKGNLINKRILELNVDNKKNYDTKFTLVKHIFYFVFLLALLLFLKPKLKFIVFSVLLILLITCALIVIVSDIREIYI